MRRRDLAIDLIGSALLAATVPPSAAWALGSARRRFVFVVASGGWDATRALLPAWGVAAMEPDAAPATAGGLTYVDHPNRPSVRAFFEAAHPRTAILHGIRIPSLSHEAATRIALTGSPEVGRPDWGTLIASASPDRPLPHLVVSGPAFAGPHPEAVVRLGADGQLAELVSGAPDTVGLPDPDALKGLSEPASSAIDRALAARAEAAETRARADAEREMVAAYRASLDRLGALRNVDEVVSLGRRASATGPLDLALDALASGSAAAVTLAAAGDFDTHDNNDAVQSILWEALFGALRYLDEGLRTRTDPLGVPLSADTVVVVLSEMGRAPDLNDDRGKDNWPHTSALWFGGPVLGGRALGGYDRDFVGALVDPATGQPDAGGVPLTAAQCGATLLAAANVDPDPWLPGVRPLQGLIR